MENIFILLLIIIGLYLWSIRNEKTLIIRNKRDELKRDNILLKKLANHADKYIDSEDVEGNNAVRLWYAEIYSELQLLLDNYRADELKFKKNPATKASETTKKIAQEKKELFRRIKILESEINVYKEYAPQIEEFNELILEDDSFLLNKDETSSDQLDPVEKYTKDRSDYKKLNKDEKSQYALDRYINKRHKSLEIGRMYKRYVGYLYEWDGWKVKFVGILDGFEDLGRDLICSMDNEIHVVQTKNWASHKVIREKHIYQLYATTIHYQIQNKEECKNKKVTPVFYSTIDYSPEAKEAADALKIKLETKSLDKNYPMIKCNINKQTDEKIYHLPFDQMYDKILIEQEKGETYEKKVSTARRKGFRRAKKYMG